MSKKRRARRRFYPEFYTDEELKRRENRHNEQSSFEGTEIKEGVAEATESAETDDTAKTTELYEDENFPENYNGFIYPRKPDAAAVYSQIENLESDYVQQKTDIQSANQYIDEGMDMDNMGMGSVVNEDIYDDSVTDSDSIEIEIPEDMYINESIELIESPEPDEFIAPVEPVENIGEAEAIETIPETEQTISVSDEPPVIEPEPIIEPVPETIIEPEAKTEITETPEVQEIYTPPELTPFDCEKAIDYARRWALGRNPDYFNYEEIGGDCTNYISQILLAGGCKMDKSSPLYGWYYNTANDKSASWTGVEQLYDYLIKDKERGIMAKEIDLNEVEAGDIVQLSFNGKTFQHTPFIVSVKHTQSGEVSYDNIKICAHSFDSENRTLDTYQWRKIRFIRILGYKEN